MLFSESFPPGFVSKFKHFKDLRRVTPGSAAITTIMAPWQEDRSVRGRCPAPSHMAGRHERPRSGRDLEDRWPTSACRPDPLTGTIAHLPPLLH